MPNTTGIEGAVQLAFPGAITLALPTLEEATQDGPASAAELIVLSNPNMADLATAAAMTDALGLPRWAVVALGASAMQEGVETVPLEETNERSLALLFRSVVARHRLLRENERLRGDLRTIAHRIMHDLRTPLGAILSSAESLNEILTDTEPSISQLTKPLFDSVDEMTRLIRRVSLLTKASANPVSKVPVAMGEVVFRILQKFERQILKASIAVAKPADWPEVSGVPDWLESIWSNLMANSLQHAKGASRIEFGWSQAGSEFRFWILNNQGRVPAEILPNLFQPFHLLHQRDAKRGLGLSLVRRLVELQGGKCGYEPYSAEGSSFFFTLPVGDPQDANGSNDGGANALGAAGSTSAIQAPSPRIETYNWSKPNPVER